MQNLAVVTVSNGQTRLTEPIENLLLTEEDAILFLDFLAQIAPLAVFHANVKFGVLLKSALVPYNVCMRQIGQEIGFFARVADFFGT